MTTLVEFIEARLDDDEQSARAAVLELSSEPWHEVASNVWEWAGLKAGATVGHVARHDPARVLREVEAKRRTLARHYRDDHGACVGCGWSGDLDEPRTDVHEECPELLDMALPYSDHPGYRPEWSTT